MYLWSEQAPTEKLNGRRHRPEIPGFSCTRLATPYMITFTISTHAGRDRCICITGPEHKQTLVDKSGTPRPLDGNSTHLKTSIMTVDLRHVDGRYGYPWSTMHYRCAHCAPITHAGWHYVECRHEDSMPLSLMDIYTKPSTPRVYR
jgi:hypothetical protein